MVKVLVTNDDGIDALGIRTLVEALAPLADVYVVAPAEQQSGKSQSITFTHPVSVEKRDMKGAAAAYAAWGTPTDCVKIGLTILEGQGVRPDFVFSGINLGYNTGLCAYYSGTVAAAREGVLNGVKSIALSAGSHGADEFGYMLGMLPMLMDMADRIRPGVIINVNAPNLPADEIKGYRILETAPFGYGLRFIFEMQGDGCYQLTGARGRTGDGMVYDIDAVNAGYVSVSPIPTSLSDRVSLSRLRNAFAVDEMLLVIVDAQEDVLPELPDGDELEARLSALTHAAARMDIPMLLTRSYGKGDIVKGVRDYASRCETAEHMQTDVWMADDMHNFTALIDANKILIAGAETHAALMSAALGFMERGYEVTVLEDCCGAAGAGEHKKAVRELRDGGARIAGLERKLLEIADGRESHVRSSVERILRDY